MAFTLGFENPYEPLCGKCKLQQGIQSPKQTYFGLGKKKTLIIIEQPSQADDFKNIPLSGESGTQFRLFLKMAGLDLVKDFVTIHAVGCHKKKEPTKKEISNCSPRIKEVIEKLKPNHIWLFGDVAIDSYLRAFYPKRFKDHTAILWSDRKIPCYVNNTWLHPMYSVDFTAKNKNEFASMIFKKHLNNAIELINEPAPIKNEDYKQVQVCLYADEIIDYLENIYHNAKYITFDYETTGLKPYNKGHKILTISASGLDRFHQPLADPIGFPFQYNNHFNKQEKKSIYKIWKAILTDSKIGKIAHHAKFEDLWTSQILKFKIKNWHFCTMMGSYLFDERKGATGLKFVSFCKWGVSDYDKKIKKYIDAPTSNSFNRLEEVNLTDLCLYNAIDTKLTEKLFLDLKPKIKKDEYLPKSFSFVLKGSLTLTEIEQNGLPADLDYFTKANEKITKKLTSLKKELLESEEAKQFQSEHNKQIDLGSPKDLRLLFFNTLKLKADKKTAKGFSSVDHEALTKIKHPFAIKLLKLRKLDKNKSTYLDQLIREISDDNLIHPFFHLHTTRTGRSSSANPNSQNLPARHEESKKLVKTGFRVPDDCYFSGVDFGSHEVRIAACFTKDPVLINYVNNPHTDMHGDTSKELFLLDGTILNNPNYTKTVKVLRFYTKNNFIFPVFYGSYWRTCARSLWENIKELEFEPGYKVLDYLAEKGITCLSNTASYKDQPKKGSYEYHIQQCESEFWRKYIVFRKWQETSKEFYLKNGYVYTKFGTRRHGYLNQNKILNSGIQGTAFQCLLWSLNETQHWLKKNKCQTQILGQIHDSILLKTYKDEAIDVYGQLRYIMEEKIREYHKWLIVPLVAEMESSPLGGTWYDCKTIDLNKTLEQREVIWVKN